MKQLQVTGYPCVLLQESETKFHLLARGYTPYIDLKSRLDSVQFNQNNTQRRARTRTLIQMGGLLNMVGLPQLCGIAEGDDLQLDLDNQDKAATLLVYLISS